MVPSGQASSSKPKRECNNTEYWKGSFFLRLICLVMLLQFRLSSKCIPETLISALVGLSRYEFLLYHLIQLPWTLLDKWLSLSHVIKLGMSSKIILSNSGWCWTVKEEGCSSFQVWIFKWSLLLCSGFYERQYLGISPIHRLVVTEYIFRVKRTKWFKIFKQYWETLFNIYY